MKIEVSYNQIPVITMTNELQAKHRFFASQTNTESKFKNDVFLQKGTNTPPDLPPAGGISSEEFNPSAKAYFVFRRS